MNIQEHSWLRCRVTPGMFDHELGVEGRQSDGSVYSLFAPKKAVDHGGQPVEGPMEGWIRVRVLSQKDDRVLIELPGQTFQNGAYVTVPVNQLRVD